MPRSARTRLSLDLRAQRARGYVCCDQAADEDEAIASRSAKRQKKGSVEQVTVQSRPYAAVIAAALTSSDDARQWLAIACDNTTLCGKRCMPRKIPNRRIDAGEPVGRPRRTAACPSPNCQIFDRRSN